jgi:hypothetical protein
MPASDTPNHIRTDRQSEIFIEKTSRPTFHSVDAVVSHDGLMRFGVDDLAIDTCVGRIMNVITDFKSDTVVAAIGVAFLLVVWRYELKVSSYLQFVENFLKGGARKLGCHAFQLLLGSYYANHVSRHEVVQLKRAVKVSANGNVSQTK